MPRSYEDDVVLREVSQEELLINSFNASNYDDECNEEDVDDSIPFTKKMRAATRHIHNISDTLVNAKLGIAMSDDAIWAEGLLVFYEIFRFLEEALVRLSTRNQHFNRVKKVLSGAERTKAFEMDLDFYYGEDRLKTYQIRQSVADYLKHLQTLEEREPLRLLAYVYHLYMGLLSGGQILQKKRAFRNTINSTFAKLLSYVGLANRVYRRTGRKRTCNGLTLTGEAVTAFGEDGRTINDIKKDIVFTVNDIACDLSNDEKESLLSESVIVFQRNNELVSSIQKTGITALKNISLHPIFLLIMFVTVGSVCYYWYFRQP